jgi:thiamine transport system substrate-binding protein
MAAAVAALLPAVAACGTSGTSADPTSGATANGAGTVTLVTHDSWAVSDDVIKKFESESGLTVKQVAAGDAGTLANQVVLTKGSPLGDAVFGIDNTFASRVASAGVLDGYTPPGAATGESQFTGLTPIDQGDVCVNVDTAWFAEHQVTEPVTLEDLAKPEYQDLMVALNPASSSPGMAFLLATVGAFGDDGFGGQGWTGYWSALKANGLKVAESWSDGYYSEFSGAGEGGTRPIVVSYSTSPAFTLTEDGSASTTRALLDTCFRQVEYAGVLAGAANPEGARALLDFLTSGTFQADIPGQMYMYPADPSVELPAEWVKFAPLAPHPFDVAPDQITAHREAWIDAWTEAVGA